MITVVPGASGAQPVAGTPRSQGPAPVEGGPSLFLAPLGTKEQSPELHASDCGETAMHRLRNPFAVTAETGTDRRR
ncbi:hypothetical protein Acsp01_54450 [Actinoplanes sp. NBRC 101535]|nr:hypothetical protein Acsp01_54450 [Actinoplanes sp. NBRC 101535]